MDEDVLTTTYIEAEKGNFDILTFLAVGAKDYYAPISKFKDDLCSHNPNNFTVYQPELSYYLLFKNKQFSFVDTRIWAKLIKNTVYKKAIDLLGKERYSVYNIINEDLIGIFSISFIAKSYKYFRKYGIFHYCGRKYTTSGKIPNDHFTYVDIFFTEIIFDLSKNDKKRYAAKNIIQIKKRYYYTIKEQKNKLYLIKVIKKILDCQYIEDKLKTKIKEEYSFLEFN